MSDLREVQNCELEILNEIVKVCDRHNITYYLSWGTLLGAIRHNGFIPWDNDIDIEIPVDDYRKFLKFAQAEMPSDFFVQTYYTDPGYNEMWAKIRKNGTTSLPLSWKKVHIHSGIGIDVFPQTGLYKSDFLRKLQTRIHGICRTLLAKDAILGTGSEDIDANKKLKLLYMIPRSVRIWICRVCQSFIFKNTRHSDKVTMIDYRIPYSMDKNWYAPAATHQFEGIDFKIPNNYDAVLRTLYGDYMTPPPVEERTGHEGLLGKIIYECHEDYKQYQE